MAHMFNQGMWNTYASQGTNITSRLIGTDSKSKQPEKNVNGVIDLDDNVYYIANNRMTRSLFNLWASAGNHLDVWTEEGN